MQRPMFIRLLLFLFVILVVSCDRFDIASESTKSELIVFAAASLAEVFTEIAHQFEDDNPGVTVILNFAGSQQLAHQLSQGAPADVFASANDRQMAAAIDTGRVIDGDHRIFAQNNLVIIYPEENPSNLNNLADLANPGQRFVLAAAEVPAGQYVQLFLHAAGSDPDYGPDFVEGVLDNVVSYEENVRAVLSKVRLGEADAGIVYTSDVWGDNASQLGTIEIPDRLNQVASYPFAPIMNSSQPELARLFTDFVLSPRGQELISGFGFRPISATE